MKLTDLPPSRIYVIQRNNSTELLADNFPSINWINWRDNNILHNQVIEGNSMKDLIKKLDDHHTITTSLLEDYPVLSNILSITKMYLEEIPDILNNFRQFDSLFEFIQLQFERSKLKHELKWAKLLESQSKTNMNLRRIEVLNGEIAQLQKKMQIIEPHYILLKNNQDIYQKTNQNLKDEIKAINKAYITKTSQINKTKRQIDSEKPKSDSYSDKLEELVSKLPKSSLSENKDYARLTNKLKTIETTLLHFKQDIDRISIEILKDKAQIKNLKDNLAKLNDIQASSSSKFNEIQKNYLDLKGQIQKKQTELDELLKIQTKSSSLEIEGDPPNYIRFSSIVQEELNSNTIKISRFAQNPDSSLNEFIIQFGKNLQISKSTDPKLIQEPASIKETNLLKLQNVLKEIENSLNPILQQINLLISIGKIPLTDSNEETVPRLGIAFEMYKQNKSIHFEKLPPEEKLYAMWSVEYLLNKLAGIDTHIFIDTDYPVKRTKILFEKIIRLIKTGFLIKENSTRVVIFLSKPILEDSIQKDMIITTINSGKQSG